MYESLCDKQHKMTSASSEANISLGVQQVTGVIKYLRVHSVGNFFVKPYIAFYASNNDFKFFSSKAISLVLIHSG